jgi:hypothetical protein
MFDKYLSEKSVFSSFASDFGIALREGLASSLAAL